MHLAVSSPSYFPSVPTHPISPHPHLFTVFPLFTTYLSRVVSILPQNFFTHTLYRADDRAAALIEREKAARYSPRLNEYHNMYLLYCIAKNLPAVEDHRLPFAISIRFGNVLASRRKFPNYTSFHEFDSPHTENGERLPRRRSVRIIISY